MKDFVNIWPMFLSNSERTIEQLYKRYYDSNALIKAIEKLCSLWLTPQLIENKKIMLKPNWVLHDIKASDEMCLRTHDNFLLAVLEYILKMKPLSILIGDAPIQGCYWDKMLSEKLENGIGYLGKKYNTPVIIKDFRRRTFNPSKNNPISERNPLSEYLIFDLGTNSYLEPITRNDRQLFRVTNYNPNRLAESHSTGIHKYCITRELFNTDVIISLPKIKTHQKTGVTGALKNIVGLNGDKDYLPHHRLGGTGFGGDCYPGKNYFRYWSELLLDFSNKRQGKLSYYFGYKASSLLWKLSLPGKNHSIAAAWSGNDTTWRMVLDLNEIVIFGKDDGTIGKKPQRQLFSLCDGIIGGQGDGPLKPEPLPLGFISLTNHSGMHDILMAALMDFDPEKIPLLRSTAKLIRNGQVDLFWKGKKTNFDFIKKYSVITKPPPGWENI